MDWIDNLFDQLNDEADFSRLSFIDSLIRTSTLSELELMRIELECTSPITNERANEIIQRLIENQQDIHQQGDYRQKAIHKHFDRVFGKI